MNKAIKSRIVAPVIVLAFAASCFGVPTFSGSLVGDGGGFIGTEQWDSASSTFSWEVTDNGDDTWHYKYELSVPSKDISHLTIEVSDVFTIDDYVGNDNPELGWYGPGENGNSDFGIPGYVYGLKFNTTTDITTMVIEFDSPKDPVWGDFFAIDGKTPDAEVYAYNEGFGASPNPFEDDDDPLDAPSNGSVDFHILVPDSDGPPGGPVIPAPAAALLATLGAGFVNVMRKTRVI